MKIVYEREEKKVSIMTIEKMSDNLLHLKALKIVPYNFPYWIVEDSEIPPDRIFRDAWEIPDDWGEPDGYGSIYTDYKEIIDAQNK